MASTMMVSAHSGADSGRSVVSESSCDFYYV